MSNHPPQAVMRTDVAAGYIGLAAATLEKMRVRGGSDCPPFVKIGRRAVGYLRSDLDDWLSSRRTSSTSVTPKVK